MATVAGALRLAGDINGKRVLVSGAGMLGIIACAFCKTKDANVTALDINEARLDISRKFGAASTLLAKQVNDDLLFDKVLEFSGVNNAMEKTLALMDIGGTAIWVGATHPQPDIHFSAEKIIRNLWTIKGLHNYNQDDFQAAVNFIETHHQDFPFDTLIEGQFNLDQANEAFDHALSASPFRVGIKL